MSDPFDFDQPARYGVMGNPVSHSKSPRIHTLFAHQFRHAIEYTAIQVDVGGFAQAVEHFRAQKGQGLNITVPFKQEAFYLADQMSERAQLAGAINTFKFEADGRVFGDNTDGTGLVHDLVHNLGMNLKNKNILVMGAGGAARGVLGPLLKQRPATLMLVNRTVNKARDLAGEFSLHGTIEACGFDELRGKHYDLVINGTAASLKGEVPPLPETLFARGALAYDMMYGDSARPFLDWALLNGAQQAVDGLGMLVEQAAESYLIWRGVRPETWPVIEKLRSEG